MSHLFTFDFSFSDLNYSGQRLRDLKKRLPGAVGEPEEKTGWNMMETKKLKLKTEALQNLACFEMLR